MIADDHHLITDGFKALIEILKPDANIFICKTAKQVSDHVASGKSIHHIFLDLTLLDTKGLDYVTGLSEKIAPEKICIISGENSPIVIKTCRNLKLAGFISKTLGEDELLEALNTVLDGKNYYPPANDDKHTAADTDCSLSKRQIEVLNLMGQGLANKEIAQQLQLSHETVKVHVRNILTALKAQSRTAAVSIARQQGLI